MNEQSTELEAAIRERLVRSSADVPEIDEIRRRVLSALETDLAVHQPPLSSIWAQGRRTAGVLVGLAAGVAVVGLLLSQKTPSTLVAADGPWIERTGTPTVDVAPPRIDIGGIGDAALTLPTEEAGAWVVRTQDDHVVTLEFVADVTDAARARQYVRILTLPPATTDDDVVNSITSSLFDTVVIDDTIGQTGGLETRVLTLETVGGTTRLGFKISEDAYLETEGIDRVFVIHVIGFASTTAVVWIEAGTEQIEEFEGIASRLVEAVVES